MANSPLQAVAEAIFARLNVSSLKAAVPNGAGCLGGVTENPMQGTTFPFLWFEVSGRDITGLGQPTYDTTEIELRLHVFSQYAGMLEARRIMREAIRLLRYHAPTVTGYTVPTLSRPNDEVGLPFEELNGVKVRELVTIWTLFADEAA